MVQLTFFYFSFLARQTPALSSLPVLSAANGPLAPTFTLPRSRLNNGRPTPGTNGGHHLSNPRPTFQLPGQLCHGSKLKHQRSKEMCLCYLIRVNASFKSRHNAHP